MSALFKLITFGWNLERTRSRNPNRINHEDDSVLKITLIIKIIVLI